MPVIAMTREMGSLGRDVAEGLAKELGLKLIYHEIVDSLVEKMHMPQSAVLRCLQGKANLLERLRVDMDVLSLYTAEEVFDLATQGNLMIRGWGATYLLRPVSHVVCVRLCAPIERRAKRIMERMGIDDSAIALEEVRRNDAAHASAMQRRFGVNWEDPVHYDVVLNTGRFSVADCIDQIKDLLGLPAFQETPQSRAHLANLALCAHVSAALKNNPETSQVRISVAAENNAEAGHLVLRGLVLHDYEKRLVEALASKVRGVRLVENQLGLMTPRFVLDVHDG